MLGNRKLVVDTFSEIYDLIEPIVDECFWELSEHATVPGAIYVIGRNQFVGYRERIRDMMEKYDCRIIHSNPMEGSETIRAKCYAMNIAQDVQAQRILLVGGGDIEPGWPCLFFENFLPKILDYEENIQAQARTEEIYIKTHKPYKFLFLNGRARPTRKYLIERFKQSGLLDQALWTNLDVRLTRASDIEYAPMGTNLMYTDTEIKYLPKHYEVDYYADRVGQANTSFAKLELFDNNWGEIYLKAEPYIDTYFSLVTETVFEYPYSFRTEKIAKPLAIGHPFITVANAGYYRDLHRIGFKTFNHVIDESFDTIDNNQDRLNRIAAVVEDLCSQDLAAFLKECYNVCKYNQSHLAELRLQVRKEFPDRFQQFIKEYHFDE